MKSCQQIRFVVLSMVECVICFAEPDTILVFKILHGVFGEGTRLAMPKTICTLDSSSLKPRSRATEGVFHWGVLGQPDYILWPYYWTVKIQDTRLRPVSGLDSPLRGRQAWQFGYVDFLPRNRLHVNPSPLWCLYKPERLVLRRPITICQDPDSMSHRSSL